MSRTSNSLALLISGLLVTNFVNAQHADPIPNDNTIYINSESSGDSLFTDIGKRLVKSGFALLTTSREFMQITTAGKIIPGFNTLYTLTISIDGSRAEVVPNILTEVTPRTSRWYYRKSKMTANSHILSDIQNTFNGMGQFMYNRNDESVKAKL